MNLEDVLLRGTRVAQPLATAVAEGMLYYVTDEGVTEQSRAGAWVAYSGTGGPKTLTGALGSEPAGVTGDLYLPTNAPFVERYSGSAWIPWGPVFPLTKPVDAGFAWVNQGGASVVTTNGVIYLLGPAGAGVNWRIRKKAAPATPYTITAYFLCSGYVPDAHQFGMVFRNSGSGILHVFTVQTNLASGTLKYLLNSLIYSSPTAFGSVYKQGGYIPSRLVMMRIADDGVNRICSISGDGQNWYAYHSVARTTNLTADEVGFAVDTESATEPIGITLLNWVEA